MWYGKGFNDGPDELNDESSFDETSGPYYGKGFNDGLVTKPKQKKTEKDDDNFSLTGGWFG